MTPIAAFALGILAGIALTLVVSFAIVYAMCVAVRDSTE